MNAVPLFLTKKEAFAWLEAGTKTIDVRKGRAWSGEGAIFQSGPNHLELTIVKKETGKLTQVLRADNYRQVIPIAENLQAALRYLQNLYGDYDRLFTAYYLSNDKNSSL